MAKKKSAPKKKNISFRRAGSETTKRKILTSDKALKEKIRDLIVKGKKFFDSGEYDKALPLFRKVIEIDSSFPDILNMMGLIFHHKGKYSQALKMFEEALTINPNYTEANLNLAVTCNDLGRFQEARFVYSRAKSRLKSADDLDPYVKGKLANLHAEIADVYQALGKHLEASEEFHRALELRPTFVDIQTKYGMALREIGQLKESIATLKAACKSGPDYTPAAIQLGLSHFTQGETKEAVRVWNEVLKKNPNEEKAKMYLRLVKTK